MIRTSKIHSKPMKILLYLLSAIIAGHSAQAITITLDVIEGKDSSGVTTLTASWDDGSAPPSLATGDFTTWIINTNGRNFNPSTGPFFWQSDTAGSFNELRAISSTILIYNSIASSPSGVSALNSGESITFGTFHNGDEFKVRVTEASRSGLAVPDSGSTLAFFGLGIAGLACLRSRFK